MPVLAIVSVLGVRPITPRRNANVSHPNVISEDDEQPGFLGMGGSGREGQFRD